MENYIFYKFDTSTDYLTKKVAKENKNDFSYTLWKPKGLELWPKGFLNCMKEMRDTPIVNMVFWWLIYKVIYRNNDYSILIIKEKEDIAHYTVILPKIYRFPFAEKNDLILGPVWTSPNYRKKGLVYLSLSQILDNFKNKRRQLWWISNEENMASRVSIEKAGFSYYGKGEIANNNKIKLFSYFHVQKQ